MIVILLISYFETGAFPIFSQTRGLSHDSTIFKFYKIRTIKPSNLISTKTNRGFLLSPGLKEKVPPFCELLRRCGLDEIPQFINVLKGEMSIVGPRPLDNFDLTILKNKFPAENKKRSELKSKPGILGLWQLNGERKLGAENLLFWDIQYENCKNISKDIDIIIKTTHLVYNNKKEDSVCYKVT